MLCHHLRQHGNQCVYFFAVSSPPFADLSIPLLPLPLSLLYILSILSLGATFSLFYLSPSSNRTHALPRSPIHREAPRGCVCWRGGRNKERARSLDFECAHLQSVKCSSRWRERVKLRWSVTYGTRSRREKKRKPGVKEQDSRAVWVAIACTLVVSRGLCRKKFYSTWLCRIEFYS